MKNKLMMLGYSSHAKVIADAAMAAGYEKVCFLSNLEVDDPLCLGKHSEFKKYIDEYDFFVSNPSPNVRAARTQMLIEGGANIVSVIHPSAVVGTNVKIGKGTFLAAGSIVIYGATIGDGVIINTAATVDHDCIVGAYTHVSVGAHLAGHVKIGKNCFIGAGSTVKNTISIIDGARVGAGAVVVKNIDLPGTYIGVPAKLMEK